MLSTSLNSAIGSKAASFKRVLIVASIGVFIGAAMSNGMMEIARHGIFRPEHFSFYDLICIFMAVMVTDIILLDIFNSLGMPTSTTVSMVFELLGATFVVALIKNGGGIGLGFDDLLNTEKALSVIPRNIPVCCDSLFLRYGGAVHIPHGVLVQLPEQSEMEDRDIRRYLRHCDCLLPPD